MKKLLFIIPLLACSSIVGAQTTSSGTASSQNAAIAASTSGWFEVALPGSTNKHYTVSYGLTTKPFITQMKMSLSVTNPIDNPMPLTGKIVDPSGIVKANWSGNVGRSYSYTFNIASLAAGAYHLDIYDNMNNKVCTIPFDKVPN